MALTIILTIIAILLIILIILGFVILNKPSKPQADDTVDKYFGRIESAIKDEFARSRNESSQQAKQSREELGSSLEKRLKTVSDWLEQVHKGLGEMQTLATGVGDLKKVLSNVKTRGMLGEFQLANILEQILSPGQYEKNVATKKGSRDIVEFAIKIPGKDKDEKPVWLPLDSKFPLESYHALLEAYEKADQGAVDEASTLLERDIKKSAKDIHEKYIDPPNTTDFAVMFLPIEGLYAEVVRKPSLIDTLQRDFRIIISGPTTLAAFLNSLYMGFRTLAIEKRSSEIWTTLGAIKTEFGKFGTILDETHKKLQEATKKIETASSKSRTIERKLKKVEELPIEESKKLLEETEE